MYVYTYTLYSIYTQLEKLWRISLYVTDESIAKLYVTKSSLNRGIWSKI